MSYGLPLYMYLDTTDKVLYPDGAPYQSLWPPDTVLPEAVQQIIINNFYSRYTSDANPQSWLRRFQNKIVIEQDKWLKLIESEDLLTDEDATRNYDVTEVADYTENTRDNITSSYNGNTAANTSGNTTTEATNTSYASDTPDGSVNDIANYMSEAAKSVGNNEQISTAESETDSNESGISDREGDRTYHNEITRKGNIGVQTAAQILGGYRLAINWCAYDIIFDELEPLFIGVWEVDDYGTFYAAH